MLYRRYALRKILCLKYICKKIKLNRSSNYNNSNDNDICYSPNGKTVPKILSTVRSLRPRAEIKTDKC